MSPKKRKNDDFYYIEKATVLKPLVTHKESYNLDEDDFPILPEGTIKYELNLMGFPIFSRNKKIKDNVSMTYEFSEKNEEYLRVIPTNDNKVISNKILQEFDEKIWYGLLKIYEITEKRQIITDYPSLMDISGIKYKSDLLKRTKDSLERLKKCELVFHGIYYDPIAKQQGSDYLRRTKHINLISSLETITFEKFQGMKNSSQKEELKKHFEKHGNIKEIAIITLNENIINNIESKAFKYFQIEDLIRIKNATARKLFILLTKWRYWEKKDIIKRKTKFLASRIPLSWKTKNITNTLKSLITACDELKKLAIIIDYKVINEYHPKDSYIEFIFVINEFHLPNQKVGIESTGQENLQITNVKEEIVDIEVVSSEEKKIKEFLELIPGQHQKKSIQIIESHFNDSEKLKRNIQYVNEKNPDDYCAYLASALKNNYAEKYIPEQKKYSEFKQDAVKCFKNCNGNCSAIWSRYEKNIESNCYWCLIFENQRKQSLNSM